MFKSILLLLSLYLRTISALTVNTTSSIQLPETTCLPRGPGLVPLRYVQCVAALGLILHEARYQPDEPQTWSHSASDPWVLRRWASRTCMIILVAEVGRRRVLTTFHRCIGRTCYREMCAFGRSCWGHNVNRTERGF